MGGGLVLFVASKLAARLSVHVPFYLGAATVLAAIGVLATGHSLVDRAEQRGTEVTLAPAAAAPAYGSGPAPIVAAIDPGVHRVRDTEAAGPIGPATCPAPGSARVGEADSG